MFLWSQFITFFGGLRAQNTFSLDYTEFLDSIDSTESTDIIDSIDSILVPHKETANIHTTHKGRTKVPMGAAREARRPHRYFCSCAREARAPRFVWC